MKMSDSELREEIYCAMIFSYRFSKTAPESVKFMKGAYKDKCFGVYDLFVLEFV